MLADSRTPPPVDVRWKLGTNETVAMRGDLPLQVKNTGTKQRLFRLSMVSSGAGGVIAEVALGELLLDAGQSTIVRVGGEKLPLRSANVSTQLIAQVEYDNDEGGTVRVAAEPEFYHTSPDKRQLMVYNLESMVQDYGGGVVPGRPALAAYELAAEATSKTAVAAQAGYVQGPTTVALEEPKTADQRALEPAPLSPAPAFVGLRICSNWRAAYEDAGFGEDYGTAQGLQDLPAAYTHATIKDSSQTVRWEGYLDSLGCTPYLTLGAGSFTLTQSSELSKSNANFSVLTRYGSAYFNWSFATAFTLGTYNPSTVNLYPTFQNFTTNANAVVAQMLRTADNGITAGSYTVYPNTGCPGMNAWDSCAWGSSAYIGTTYPDGSSDSNSKIIITHEIGHTVQSVAMGMLTTNYGGDWDAPPLCNCSHIDDPQGINNLHCLQSKEYVSDAELEGFAQFMAVKGWNNPAQTDCWWAYYKPFRDRQGEFGTEILYPPMLRGCGAHYDSGSPTSWMEWSCSQNMTNHGVEWDWQGFLWNVNTQGTTKSTMTDIYTIYKTSAACGGNCNGDDVHWSDLDTSARSYYGQYDPRYTNWTTRGDNAGVNH